MTAYSLYDCWLLFAIRYPLYAIRDRGMAKVTLPDGAVLQVGDGTTAGQLAQQIGQGLARAAVAARIDGELV
ncbi:MAG: TGS domain-containing protein, partial [Phycisphaerales bacterium]